MFYNNNNQKPKKTPQIDVTKAAKLLDAAQLSLRQYLNYAGKSEYVPNDSLYHNNDENENSFINVDGDNKDDNSNDEDDDDNELKIENKPIKKNKNEKTVDSSSKGNVLSKTKVSKSGNELIDFTIPQNLKDDSKKRFVIRVRYKDKKGQICHQNIKFCRRRRIMKNINKRDFLQADFWETLFDMITQPKSNEELHIALCKILQQI